MLDELGHDLVLSRRRVLSGIAVLGAAGVMVPVARSNENSDPPPDTDPPPPSTTSPAPAKPKSSEDGNKKKRGDLVLKGLFARIVTPDGDGPSSSSADLVDDNANPIGSFWSAALDGGGAITLFHTFQLADGTLHGQGFGPLEEATFALVGGTGAYKGARGQYVARQRPVAAGGDGSAEFVFDLLTGKE